MTMGRGVKSCAVFAAITVVLGGFHSAQAGGLFSYEVGTPDMFTAGAGWAARAQDAATVFTNPAGMARLKGSDLLVGSGAFYGDIQLSPNANTTVAGGDGGVAVGWFPNGGAFFAHELSDRWAFGIAATSNFGLSGTYDEGWVGRYYVEKSTLLGLSFVPSVAYRVSPKLSLGAGLNAVYGILENEVAISALLPSVPDGHMKLSDQTLGFGGNGGVLFEPSDKLRVGATYTSPVKLDFGDRPEYRDLSPGMEALLRNAGLLDVALGLGITVPQTVMASFYADLGSDWAVMGDAGWQNWSRFGRVDVGVATDPPTGLTTEMSYKDTWHGALGAKRRLGDRWSLAAGVGYDSSPVEHADRTISMPLGEAWRFAIGTQRHVSERFELGLGYTLQWLGYMPVDQQRGPLAGRVAGAYDDAAGHVVSLQGHWRF